MERVFIRRAREATGVLTVVLAGTELPDGEAIRKG